MQDFEVLKGPQNWNWEFKAGLLEEEEKSKLHTFSENEKLLSNPHNTGTERNSISLIQLETGVVNLSMLFMCSRRHPNAPVVWSGEVCPPFWVRWKDSWAQELHFLYSENTGDGAAY